jgi:hypothetical protein
MIATVAAAMNAGRKRGMEILAMMTAPSTAQPHNRNRNPATKSRKC